MAEKKIPLLTDVYQPKVSESKVSEIKPSEYKPTDWVDLKPRQDEATLITPELIARVASHIKPRLEADITKSVTESVRDALKNDLIQALQDEIVTTQAAIESRTVDFVDKTKADLKTELPRMYQDSAELVFSHLSENINALQTEAVSKFDATLSDIMETALQAANAQISSHVETLQADANTRISHDLNQEIYALQTQALGNHQALLGENLNNIFQSISQSAKIELQQQLDAMQAEALTQMRATFNEAMPSIYTSAVAEQQEAITTQIGESLNQELQVFQSQTLSENQAKMSETLDAQQAQLSATLEESYQALNQTAKQELAQHIDLLQADILSQMGTTFNDAIPSIYAAAVDDVKTKFADEMTAQSLQLREDFLATINADLPAVQEVMRDNIQQILATSLPSLELDLRNQLTSELQDLLLKVKFVLPK
ncbi:MAG: hypothetical protein ABL880_06855 [Methylotenera sp.]